MKLTVSAALRERVGAKPFLKWAGGKGQLLDEIAQRLPYELDIGTIATYVEPFLGGGAVFFHIAQRYDCIKHFYLFEINEDLVDCYNAVKENVGALIDRLNALQRKFLRKDQSQRKDFYYRVRDDFNGERDPAKLIFLNKTCYNGLYRVNRKGEFNVPFGDYEKPAICDEKTLVNVSELLQKAEIICGDFEESASWIDDKTFVYFDPPYRPLSRTASFTSYAKEDFDERSQIRLAEFCRRVDGKGAKFLLSNSDPKNEDPKDRFFEDHYEDFTVERVKAVRAINCKGSRRGEIRELLITNY
jgi:DNA adenine methylase